MSKATKRKHVTKEVLDEFVLPDDKKEIVRVRLSFVLQVISFAGPRGFRDVRPSSSNFLAILGKFWEIIAGVQENNTLNFVLS